MTRGGHTVRGSFCPSTTGRVYCLTGSVVCLFDGAFRLSFDGVCRLSVCVKGSVVYLSVGRGLSSVRRDLSDEWNGRCHVRGVPLRKEEWVPQVGKSGGDQVRVLQTSGTV